MLALLPAAWSSAAAACSCAKTPSIEEAFTASAVVFLGRVVAVEREGPRLRARLAVETRWKGSVGDTVRVDHDTMCGYEFEEGTRVLVYAAETADPLTVSLCSRTRLAAAAGADLAKLDSVAKNAPTHAQPARDTGARVPDAPAAPALEPGAPGAPAPAAGPPTHASGRDKPPPATTAPASAPRAQDSAPEATAPPAEPGASISRGLCSAASPGDEPPATATFPVLVCAIALWRMRRALHR